MNTIQYVVVNKELGMSPGKAMAQVAHALALVVDAESAKAYSDASQRTVIVLEGTGEQIKNLHIYLSERNIASDYVIDEGVNEIPPMSVTALATRHFNIDDHATQVIFGQFKLYSHDMQAESVKFLEHKVARQFSFEGYYTKALKYLMKGIQNEG